MYPLGLASILSVAIIIERFWTIRQSVKKVQELRSKILGYLKRNQPDKALSVSRLSPLGSMYEAVLTGDARNEAKWLRTVERRRVDIVHSLRKNVWFLKEKRYLFCECRV